MIGSDAAAPEAAFLLWHHLRASARVHASRPAVVWRDSTLTYGELAAQSDRVEIYWSVKNTDTVFLTRSENGEPMYLRLVARGQFEPAIFTCVRTGCKGREYHDQHH